MRFLLGVTALLCGCAHTHTKELTPWFRVSVHYPASTIIAESGGPHPTSDSERLSHGRWILVSDSSSAMAIDSGARVVYIGANGELRWTDANGNGGELPCHGRPVAQNQKSGIVCIDMTAAESIDTLPASPTPVTVSWLDSNGRAIHAPRVLELPAAKSLGWSERFFLGFSEDDPVVVQMNPAPGEKDDFFKGQTCTYYLLAADGARVVGTPFVVDKAPMYETPKYRSCDEPEVVRRALAGVPFARGVTLSD